MNESNPEKDGTKKLFTGAVRTPSDSVTEEMILGTDLSTHKNFTGLLERFARDADKDRVVQRMFFGMMKMRELLLMQKAFDKATGQADPAPQETRDNLVAALAEDYRVYGLASGLEHASQLVRDFEASAVKQAGLRR